MELGLDYEEVCPSPDTSGSTQPRLTPARIATALRRLPIPPSELIIEPPNGRTLVNFDTNLYTETTAFTETVTLLGRTVDLRLTPTTYTWHHGDGTTQTSTTPGAPYPDLQITHAYTTAEPVRPSVEVTYTARYRVQGGPWQPVPGTVTIPGTPADLDVVEARPTLVSSD